MCARRFLRVLPLWIFLGEIIRQLLELGLNWVWPAAWEARACELFGISLSLLRRGARGNGVVIQEEWRQAACIF